MITSFHNCLGRLESGYIDFVTMSHSGGGSSSVLTSLEYLNDDDLTIPTVINFTHAAGAYTIFECLPVRYGFSANSEVVLALLNHTLRATDEVSFELMNGLSSVLTTPWRTVLKSPNDALVQNVVVFLRNAPAFTWVKARVRPTSSLVYHIGEIFIASAIAPSVGGPLFSSFKITYRDPSERREMEDGSLSFFHRRKKRVYNFSTVGLTAAEAVSQNYGSSSPSIKSLLLTVGRRYPVICLPYAASDMSVDAQRFRMQSLAIHGLFSQLGSIEQISNDASGPRYAWTDAQIVETA